MIQRLLNDKKSLLVLIASIGLLVAFIGAGIWATLSGTASNSHARTKSGSPIQTKGIQVSSTDSSVSPLLFGTNLGLFNSKDQVLQSGVTRTLLSQMHMRIIRMPVRSSLTEETEISAAQIIKSLGAVPLVVLRGAVDTNVLADDTRIINDMNRIFGNNTVYYEYGNEEDLLGVNVSNYTASWNSIIPQLQRVALHGQFIGPVNYQYDRNYLITFLQAAHPRPDEVSWHEYTCDDSWSKDICVSHIDHWTNHISDARSAMAAAIGTALPIMITEWNYAPNAVPNDGKNNDSNFMTIWTTKAIQTLAANRVFASMQYSCTDTAVSLIGSNATLTMQGRAFQNQYQQMITDGHQPAPAPQPTAVTGQPQPTSPVSGSTPNPNPTIALNSYQSFSFEDGGTDGWGGHGSQVTGVQNSTTLALSGTHALQVTLTNVANDDFPYVSVGGSRLVNYPHAGQTLIAYVYLPSNSVSFAAKVFVMDSNYHWFSPNAMTTLMPGIWNRLTFTLPSAISGQPRSIGIQFNNLSSVATSSDVYIDAVSWG